MEYQALGRRIKQARENAGLTQTELAARLDCTPQHISAIERGAKTPRLDTFVALANILQVSADALLAESLDRPSDSLAREFSSAVAHLSGEAQLRILRAIRVLTEEI